MASWISGAIDEQFASMPRARYPCDKVGGANHGLDTPRSGRGMGGSSERRNRLKHIAGDDDDQQPQFAQAVAHAAR